MSADRGDDEVEKLLRDARFVAPSGLAARLAARARDPEAGRVIFWADVERTSRSLLGKVAAAAVLAAGLALASASGFVGNQDSSNLASSAVDSDVTLDQVARLAVSPSAVDALVNGTTSTLPAPAQASDEEDR